MNAGALGIVTDGALTDTDASTLNQHHEREEFIRERGEQVTLEAAVHLDGTVQTYLGSGGDVDAVEGDALKEEPAEEERYRVTDEGFIEAYETQVVSQKQATFAAVPGSTDESSRSHDGFTVVSTTSGYFAFDLIGGTQPHCEIKPAHLNLKAFLADNQGSTLLEVGWDDVLETGVRWAEEEIADETVAEVLDTRQRVQTLDIMLESGERVSVAQSGWIDVYYPDMETAEFVDFVAERFLPYASEQVGDGGDD